MFMMSKKQQIFRLLLWGYVFAHAWLSWHDVIWGPIAFLFLIGTDSLSARFARLFSEKRYRLCIAVAAFVLLLPLLLGVLAWLADTFILPIPLAEIYNGLMLSPLWLPGWIFFILGVIVRLRPALYRYDLLPRLCVLILSFWAGKDYQILFYSHPGTLLLSLLIYLSAEALFLMRQNPALKNARLSAHAVISFIAFILPLTLACLATYHFISNTMTKNTGGVLKPTMNSFDFNDSLNLENEIQLGQNLLLFVHLNQQATEKMLFKRHDLAGYHPDKGFFAIKELGSSLQVPKEPLRILSPKYQGRYTIQQEFFLIDVEKDAFFSLDYPKEIIPLQPQAGQKSRFRSSYIATANAILDRETLELNDSLFSAGSTQLSTQEKNIYLDYADMAEIADLARQVVGDESSGYNQAKMLETYFKLHYLYSLKPGAGNKILSHKEALYDFLFASRKGYCTYFAFSMALMARSLGLPARVVTGFFINPQDNLMGYYPVKGQQAHAWVEVFFDDFGWISFDPTSDQLSVDSLDSMNNTYEPDDLFPFVEEMLQTRIPSVSQEQAPKFKTVSVKDILRHKLFSWQNLILVFMLLVLIYLALLLWAHWPLLNIHALSPRKMVQLYARQLVFEYNHFHKQSLTALEYLSHEQELLTIYRAALFSPDFTQQQAHSFLKSTRRSAYLPRANRFKRFCFIFSPSWIMFRINYAALF